jgi:hypothetical protein
VVLALRSWKCPPEPLTTREQRRLIEIIERDAPQSFRKRATE